MYCCGPRYFWTTAGTVDQVFYRFCGYTISGTGPVFCPCPATQSRPLRELNRGFTLFEALIALAIIAIFVSVAVPALTGTVNNARRTHVINDLVTAVQVARTSAIRRNKQVVICADEGSNSCQTHGDWRKGWVIFVNSDFDWPPHLDDNDIVLQRYGPPGRIDVNSNRRYFAFHRIGLRSTNGTVTVCDSRGSSEARAVIISYTGRPRVSHRRADGSDLQCL